MVEFLSLVELLRDRAQQLPNQLAYTFLADGQTESGNLTYQQLDRQATAIAYKLQTQLTPGARILVIYPYNAGLEFIAAFFGCLYAGAIAVTMNPPTKSDTIPKVLERLQACEASMVLTTESLLTQLKHYLSKKPELAASVNSVPWIATDTLPLSIATDWVQPSINPDTIAFLQYTSGSTGTPKGVMVTHGNVLHNSAIIHQCFEHTPASQGVIWLPMFHDMGLIGGVIQPMYGKFPVALMSPIALVQQPLRWLEAVSRYQATTSGGPNFAYDLVCRQVKPEQLKTLDLSHWEVAFSGAEPIRPQTLERFTQTFAPCGFRAEAFYPCYGMAETTLLISGGLKTVSPVVLWVDGVALEENNIVLVDSGQPNAVGVVSCGQTWYGDEVVIVNPKTLTAVAEDQVGEIWFKGAGVGKGYWQQPEETQNTFQATLGERGPFLRTGDLGFLHNGELFITGRIKEMMILWGRNRYPHEIEQTVEQCHPALRPSCIAAFSIEIEGEERLIIAAEVERRFFRQLNSTEVITAIREAINIHHTVDVYSVALLKPATLPKTSSGKIQRRVCRQQFLAGTLKSVAQWQYQQLQDSNLSRLTSESD
ncbi:MAG: fatty acyl-AMP ligase [Microcoleaceae cyanobacterium]